MTDKNMEMEYFETHMDRMERERQAQQATLELAKENTKQAKVAARSDTKETFVYVLGIVAVAAVAIALAIFWFTDIGENPNESPKVSDSQIEQQREERCIDTEGGWLPAKTFSGSYPEHGMCVYPGKPVEAVK